MPRKIKATPPKSVWTRHLRLDGREFFRSVVRAALHGVSGQWAEVAADTADTASALGLKDDPENIVWVLVTRSIRGALTQLISEQEALRQGLADVDARIDTFVGDVQLSVDSTLFKRPADLPLVQQLIRPIIRWLTSLGAPPMHAATIAYRFPAYFVFALRDEWRRNEATYARLTVELDGPFERAAAREEQWRDYTAYLDRVLDEPVFGEVFGLRQVYVPLRASFFRHPASKSRGRLIVDLRDELRRWLTKDDIDDALRIISGGPGSGKSSFCRVFAADHAQIGHRVIYIPLHDIEPVEHLETAIGRYVQAAGFFTHNPAGAGDGEESLLIILDGLDELAMQGQAAIDAARSFLRSVERDLAVRNRTRSRWRILITGRDVLVQATAADGHASQILEVLPYYTADMPHDVYLDPEKRLLADQRNEWWKLYGDATGRDYEAIPLELKRDELDAVTSQPLLNYLVAFSFARNKIDFRNPVSVNEIYAELVSAVYERTYARRHPSVDGLSRDEFLRVLEEIALATWHGTGRAASIAEIGQYCERSGLSRLLTRFTQDASSGVVRLLTAFYFRQQGHYALGEQVFEFTHKSFAEYLAARRIIQSLDRIATELDVRDSSFDRGWSESDALVHWSTICATTSVDAYLLRFIQGEAVLARDRAGAWQAAAIRLIGHVLCTGFPLEAVTHVARTSGRVSVQIAEEALLLVLNACALATRRVSRISWPDELAAGNWISRLRGQRRAADLAPSPVLSCLSLMDFSNCVLFGQDLCEANLSRSIFENAHLERTLFARADLTGADLTGAQARGASFEGARLLNATLNGSELTAADFTGATVAGMVAIAARLDSVQQRALERGGAVLGAFGYTSERA